VTALGRFAIPGVSDSLALAVANAAFVVAAFLLGAPSASNTAEFVLFFGWPLFSLPLALLTLLWAVRDSRGPLRWQAFLAVVLASAVMLSLTQYRGFGYQPPAPITVG